MEVNPFTIGAAPRPDGRYSGVFFADDKGLSYGRRGGVKPLSSRSRRMILGTGVKVAGAAFTGVKPPMLTGVNPEVIGCGCGVGGVGV